MAAIVSRLRSQFPMCNMPSIRAFVGLTWTNSVSSTISVPCWAHKFSSQCLTLAGQGTCDTRSPHRKSRASSS